MKTFKMKIEGLTPLMQHRMPQETLFGLLGSKTEKKKDKEILTPRQIAEKHVYQNEKLEFYVPAEFISGAIASVAGDYKQKHSGRKSLKGVIAGVFRPVNGISILKTRSGKVIKKFEVDVRKGTNHQKGAVAICRPRFDDWSIDLEVNLDDTILSPDTCLQMLEDAGKRAGIGSFRVQKGGYFGQFVVTSWKEIDS